MYDTGNPLKVEQHLNGMTLAPAGFLVVRAVN